MILTVSMDRLKGGCWQKPGRMPRSQEAGEAKKPEREASRLRRESGKRKGVSQEKEARVGKKRRESGKREGVSREKGRRESGKKDGANREITKA